jgi:hypothetical protein
MKLELPLRSVAFLEVGLRCSAGFMEYASPDDLVEAKQTQNSDLLADINSLICYRDLRLKRFVVRE